MATPTIVQQIFGANGENLSPYSIGQTLYTGNGQYTWRVISDPSSPTGKNVQLVSQSAASIPESVGVNASSQTTTQSPYLQIVDQTRPQTQVYDLQSAEMLVKNLVASGQTNMQVVYISPDGDPYKRRVYDVASIAKGGAPYVGSQSVLASNIGKNTYNPYTGQGTWVTLDGRYLTGQEAADAWQAQTGLSPADLIAQTQANNAAADAWNTGNMGDTVLTGKPTYQTTQTGMNLQPTEPGYGGTQTTTGTYTPSTVQTTPVTGETIVNNNVPPTTPVTGAGGTGGTGGTTWDTMNTTPINTINAQDITWRNLPSELFTFPFWREGMSGSTTTAGSTPGYNMQQPRYSPELFFPAAQQWGNWTPSERSAYQSAVQGTGASWDDVFEGLKKKWGVFTNTVQPTWAHTGGKFNWTPAGYSK